MSRLTPLAQHIPGRNELWLYRCECGAEVVKTRRSVQSGQIKSCGCLNAELRLARNTKHGGATRGNHAPEYWIWQAMKQRCRNHRHKHYADYGGRGIRVCARWAASFAAFISDVGPRPSSRHSIDRVDNDGNYEPGNCKWSTSSEQARNRRSRWRHVA